MHCWGGVDKHGDRTTASLGSSEVELSSVPRTGGDNGILSMLLCGSCLFCVIVIVTSMVWTEVEVLAYTQVLLLDDRFTHVGDIKIVYSFPILRECWRAEYTSASDAPWVGRDNSAYISGTVHF